MRPKKKYTAAQKAEFAEAREASAAKAKEALENGLRALQSSDDWTTMLERVAKNARVRYSIRRYSFGNQLLLLEQTKGSASACASYKMWQAAGRQVRKGERGLLIRQPKPFSREVEGPAGEKEQRRGVYFGTCTVFDVSQTDGADDSIELCPVPSPDSVFSSSVETLRSMALGLAGAPVSSITVRARESGDPHGASGWYRPSTREIVVLQAGNEAAEFSVLVHEIAHAIMHGQGDHHSTSQREVEAESVSFIVCSAFDLDTSRSTFPYVASWAGKGGDAAAKVAESGDRIMKAANLVLDSLFNEETIDTEMQSEA